MSKGLIEPEELELLKQARLPAESIMCWLASTILVMAGSTACREHPVLAHQHHRHEPVDERLGRPLHANAAPQAAHAHPRGRVGADGLVHVAASCLAGPGGILVMAY